MTITESTVSGGASRSSFLAMLKTEYGPLWNDHVHKKVMIASIIAKKKGVIAGKSRLDAVVAGLPQSSGVAVFEGATLPTPSVGEYFNPTLFPIDLYARLRWTGKVERAARSGGAYAWARPRAMDMKHAREQFDINFARMLYLGPYQPIAVVASYNAGTLTATLYGRNARTSLAADFYKNGAQYLRKGMAVDFASTVTANPTGLGIANPTNERTVASIDASDPDAPTFTLSAAAAIGNPADTHVVIPFASRRDAVTGAMSDFGGPNGLVNLIGDSSLYSVIYELTRSSYPTLSGLRQNNGGVLRSWSDDYLMVLLDRIADEGTGDEPTVAIGHRTMRRERVRERKADQQFTPVQTERGFGDMPFRAGDTTLEFKYDRDCLPGMFFAVYPGDFGWLENSPMGPIDEASERWVTDKDAHEIIFHKAGNTYTETPYNNGMVEDFEYRTDRLT